MDDQNPNIELALRYLRTLEQTVDFEALGELFTPDFVQTEYPNRFVPDGARRTLDEVRAAFMRGRGAVSAQRYDVRTAIASGDTVALEVDWTGTLRIAVGSIPVGGEMRMHFAAFLTFRDGKIAEQRNYDCFEPW